MSFLRRLKVERCVKCGKVATEELVTADVRRIAVYCRRCGVIGLRERLELENHAEKRGIKVKPP